MLPSTTTVTIQSTTEIHTLINNVKSTESLLDNKAINAVCLVKKKWTKYVLGYNVHHDSHWEVLNKRVAFQNIVNRSNENA
jgi:hypothetical protein